MPTTSAALSFAALAFALIIVPGPSVMFVISRGITLGRRGALETVAGNALGIYVQVAFVAFGLGAIVQRSAAVYSALKLAGAAYLIWLGAQTIRHRRLSAEPLETADNTTPVRRSAFADGVIVGVANPKSIVFFAALLPQFVDRSGAAAWMQMLVLGAVFVGIALLLDSVWAVAAGSARDWLSSRPRRRQHLDVASGVTMIGLGVLLGTTGRGE